MTKDEALEMAIDLLESLKTGKENFAESNIHVVCSMCEEALATNEESLLVQSAQEVQQESDYAGRKLTASDEFLAWNRENETKMYVSIASEYHVFEKALEIAIKHNLLPFTEPPAQNSFREVSLADAPSIYTNEQGQAWANGYTDALEALALEALAQPAQEPVAWMDKSRYFLELDLEDLCVMASCKKHEAVPLYTHPAPAKEWVGLSDDEKHTLVSDWVLYGLDEWQVIEAVQRALKEKNHD